jgi:hypothetical protein
MFLLNVDFDQNKVGKRQKEIIQIVFCLHPLKVEYHILLQFEIIVFDFIKITFTAGVA